MAEAAVIGVADARWGERPVACVVLRTDGSRRPRPSSPCSPSSSAGCAKWWLPDDIVFLDHIPKTSVGKFSKKELRDLLAAGHEVVA